ncbi:MAG: glycerol-3-phosphate 1-O-acyltransferase PlsY [Candidatus Margulisbacteria bacterium]|nr:glycerol-3-phosphate 1-O-acyltransferase PlsY [Candidatus Margulisiibacteriota bacterium]
MGQVSTNILLVMVAAYLLGSIPFGYLIARIWNIDIRRKGSGNIGATNVFRTIGPLAGSLVFLLDLLKGALPVLLAKQLTANPWLVILVGIATVLGHTYPIFLKFKGGRGAATGFGFLLAVAPDIFIGALILVILIILLTRYVSLASIITSPLVTLAFFLLKRPLPYGLIAALVSVIIILRHIPNIKRLLAGTESRIGVKNDK